MILSLLAQLINIDLGLTEVENSHASWPGLHASLRHGQAADGPARGRKSRRTVAGPGVMGWVIVTVARGLASNFVQIFLARRHRRSEPFPVLGFGLSRRRFVRRLAV